MRQWVNSRRPRPCSMAFSPVAKPARSEDQNLYTKSAETDERIHLQARTRVKRQDEAPLFGDIWGPECGNSEVLAKTE
jgi:hypothetical protein